MVVFTLIRNQKKEADLANALSQWRNAEAALSAKESDYTKLLADNRNLNNDLTDLQGQLENVWARPRLHRFPL